MYVVVGGNTMSTKAVCPANTDCLKDNAEYEGWCLHSDGGWSIAVQSGSYQPPEGWEIDHINMLDSTVMVHISRSD